MAKRSLALLGSFSLILLATFIALALPRPAKTVFPTISGTTEYWNDGSKVNLSADRVAKINDELAAIIEKDAPGQGLIYKIASSGIGIIELTRSTEFPEALRQKLGVYTDSRVQQLVEQQEKANL